MKKITLLVLTLGFSAVMSAQCLDAVNGQWPTATYTPTTCDGVTVNTATTVGYASEYSEVNVTAGETYQFSSSILTDVITISDEAGTTSLAYGENGYVMWVSDVTGVIRFYTHKDNACSEDGFVFRYRNIVCGTPPSCLPPMSASVGALSVDSATLNWVASPTGPADGYDYILTEDSTAPDAGTAPTGSVGAGVLTMDFSGLNPTTHYYFWVRANCGGGDFSAWKGKDFTTLSLPPVNDDISGAIELVLDLGTACGANQLTGVTNNGSTASNEVAPSCTYNPSPGNGDVWLYFVAPAPTVTINVSGVTGPNLFTISNVLYSGTSGNLTEVGACNNTATKVFTGLTTGDTYYLRMWDYNNDGTGTWNVCGYYLDCEMPVATYTVVSDCANGPQFNVNVEVTNMGTASSLTISDDQGNTQTANGTGVYTFGPYTNATNVIYTVANDQNAACTITSSTVTQAICPPDCAAATPIANCGDEITATIVAGAGAWNVGTCGFTTSGTELVYSFTPAETGDYSLEITAASGGYIDYFWKEASGSCDATGWTCIDDNNAAGVDPIGTLTAGVQYLILLDGEGTTERTATFKIKCPPTCTNATVNYQVVSLCDGGTDEFNVNVNVTDMGTATSMTISDDQGNAPQNATAIGTYTFGPYANGTPVVFTVANDNDATCVLTSPTQNQTACPPSNDNCDQAIAIAVGAAVNDIIMDASNVGATASSQTAPATCGGYSGGDVWYTLVVPPSGNVTIETNDSTTGDTGVDTVVTVYAGTCDALTQVGCDDDGADTGAYSKVSVTGQTPGATLYLRTYEYGNNNFGGFGITAYDPSMLGVNPIENKTLSAYPNPVTNILNVSYAQNINSVAVYNLLGQQVMNKTVNATAGQIDMTTLSAGAYFVMINTVDGTKTVKVLKR